MKLDFNLYPWLEEERNVHWIFGGDRATVQAETQNIRMDNAFSWKREDKILSSKNKFIFKETVVIQWGLKKATLYHSSDDERPEKENAHMGFLWTIYDAQKKGICWADSQAINAHSVGMKSGEWQP